uniref:Heat shock protein, alpha-crystallin-related, b12 n=2 Tax=Nothobranchius rachovii TaxID=451742 RepID=A0A1A8NSP2_9TELE
MTSMTSSSQRSSSSFSSSRFSTSSSYKSEGSLNGSSDSLDVLLEPFMDSSSCSGLFGEENATAATHLSPFNRNSRASYGQAAPVGGAVSAWHTGAGSGGNCLNDTYYTSADVSQFEPHDIVVMAFNHQVIIQAQKVLEDGSVIDSFTHKSQFPEDMDPLSVSGNLSCDGTLLVGVRRTAEASGPELLGVSTYRTQAHL